MDPDRSLGITCILSRPLASTIYLCLRGFCPCIRFILPNPKQSKGREPLILFNFRIDGSDLYRILRLKSSLVKSQIDRNYGREGS